MLFEKVDKATTKVTVELEHETEGMMEALGSAVGADSRQVKADLERFKEFIESRGAETGAWRGEVNAGRARSLVERASYCASALAEEVGGCAASRFS